MKKILFLFTIIFLFFSCKYFQQKKATDNLEEKIKMIAADKAFSKLSVDKGMKKAFLQFIDSNGVLLKPNKMPIISADAIDFLSQINDSGVTLEWQPLYGAIAKSCDLGYTYGVYSVKLTEKDTTLYGTYVSIWRKQTDGSWKFVLDSGNEGIGKVE